MPKYSRQELDSAFEKYNALRLKAQETGDWNLWAAVFTEDDYYLEHAHGEFHGREAIAKRICEVMSPFPEMTFPQDWVAYDEEKGAIVFQCQNRLPHPTDPEGDPFSFPTWTRLVYAGEGLFSSDEDIYNPTKDAGPTVKAWMQAGGRFATKEKVKMQHSGH